MEAQTLNKPRPHGHCLDPDAVPASMRAEAPEQARARSEAESDRRRFRRALLDLEAFRIPELAPRAFFVTGGEEDHYVNLDRGYPLCDCPDYLNRGCVCAHAMCAMLEDSGMNVLYVVDVLAQARAERLARRVALDGKAVAA